MRLTCMMIVYNVYGFGICIRRQVTEHAMPQRSRLFGVDKYTAL